ncbi:MAG TPA: PIG-L family deacetylase, partial [Cytophagaceae bacterium]
MNYLFSLLIFSFLTSVTVTAQPNVNYNAAQLHEDLERLTVLGSVLYLAAHPDDENTRLITYFTKEKKYNTAYLSLTRGGGGQNLIGTELNEQLGVIRTQELLAARLIDGGKQFFSRARDFGFSKTPDETFEVWDKEKVLADVVWVIRNFQPDVIVTRFNTEPGRTHGHHTASAILASEAFDAAADPKRFPEQLKYVDVWQVKRLVWNTNSWFYTNPSEFNADSMLTVDVGGYNNVLGKSYSEIAAESRSMHKSQGFGASGTRGVSLEYLEHTKGPKAKKDLFEDINVTWSRIQGGEKIGEKLQEVYKNFSLDNPSASLDALLDVRKLIIALPDGYWKKVKLQELDAVIKGTLGLWTEAVAADYSAVPGEKIKVTIEAINRTSIPVELKQVRFSSAVGDTSLSLELKQNIGHTLTTFIKIAEKASYSGPYWLREKQEIGMFTVSDQQLIGMAENPPAVSVAFTLNIKGQTIEYTTPLVYKKTDPVKGEIYRPFEIVPPVFVNLSEDLIVFADTKPKTLSFSVRSSIDKVEGVVKVAAPQGWRVEPSELPLKLSGEGVEINYQVKVYPSEAASQEFLQIYA